MITIGKNKFSKGCQVRLGMKKTEFLKAWGKFNCGLSDEDAWGIYSKDLPKKEVKK